MERAVVAPTPLRADHSGDQRRAVVLRISVDRGVVGRGHRGEHRRTGISALLRLAIGDHVVRRRGAHTPVAGHVGVGEPELRRGRRDRLGVFRVQAVRDRVVRRPDHLRRVGVIRRIDVGENVLGRIHLDDRHVGAGLVLVRSAGAQTGRGVRERDLGTARSSDRAGVVQDRHGRCGGDVTAEGGEGGYDEGCRNRAVTPKRTSSDGRDLHAAVPVGARLYSSVVRGSLRNQRHETDPPCRCPPLRPLVDRADRLSRCAPLADRAPG